VLAMHQEVADMPSKESKKRTNPKDFGRSTKYGWCFSPENEAITVSVTFPSI